MLPVALDEHQQPLKLSPASKRDLANKKLLLLSSYDWTKGGVGLHTRRSDPQRSKPTAPPAVDPHNALPQARNTSRTSQNLVSELPKVPVAHARAALLSTQIAEDADDVASTASSFDASQLLSSHSKNFSSPLPRYSDAAMPLHDDCARPAADEVSHRPQPEYAASISSSDLFLKLTPQYDMLLVAAQPQEPVLSWHTSQSGSERVFDDQRIPIDARETFAQVTTGTSPQRSERGTGFEDANEHDFRFDDDTVLAEDSQLQPLALRQDSHQPFTLSFLPEPYHVMTHISQIQSEPLELAFHHPCMITVEGFPAVYRPVKDLPKGIRDERKKRKESGKRQEAWPWCLKQMWEMADLPRLEAGALLAIDE